MDKPGFFTGRTAAYRVASDDFGLSQLRDLFRIEAELGKHLLGLLAELRGSRHHLAWGSRERNRLTKQTDVSVLGVRHILRDAEMLDLGVLEHLVDRIDRAAGDPGGVEFANPSLGGFLFSQLVDRGVERVAVLRARRGGG